LYVLISKVFDYRREHRRFWAQCAVTCGPWVVHPLFPASVFFVITKWDVRQNAISTYSAVRWDMKRLDSGSRYFRCRSCPRQASIAVVTCSYREMLHWLQTCRSYR
jgi:hypothetical protein